MAFVAPVTLEGRHVRLEPMTRACADALASALGVAAGDGDMWESRVTAIPRPEGMRAYVDQALSELDLGVSMPYVTIDRASGRVVGSTRYMNIEAPHRRLEIGTTWLGKSVQRTAINTEAKYLMLRHAFEALRCIAVDLRTHEKNVAIACRDRAPRGQARRRAAPSPDPAGRQAAQHGGLFHHRCRVAGGQGAAGGAIGRGAMTRC